MFKNLAVSGFICFSTVAGAEDCAERDIVVERLGVHYSEQLTAGGLQEGSKAQSVVEVWASPETGTFTVMMTSANGISCILATGTDWFNQETVALPVGKVS